MADVPLRLVPEDAGHPWAYDVNALVRLVRGVSTGGIAVRGDLGTRRDLTDPNSETAGHYTATVQSKAAGGRHAAFVLSGTSVQAAPTIANSAVLIEDAGIVLGTSARLDAERLRVYEPGRVDYADLTSLDGELVLGGSGARAGGMAVGAGGAIRILEASGGDYASMSSSNGELNLGGSGPSAGGLSLTSALRVLGGTAIQLFNAANTAAGQLAANGAGDLVVAGTTGNLVVNGALSAGGAAQQLTATDVTLTAPWTAFTPTLVQGGAAAITVDYARYRLFGKLAVVRISLSVTGAGGAAAGSDILVSSIPAAIAPASTGPFAVCGSSQVYDQSAGQVYAGVAFADASTRFGTYLSGVGALPVGRSPAFTLAAGDHQSMALAYEVA